MAAFRLIAWLLIGLGLALFGADGVSSLETGEPVMRSTAQILGYLGVDGAAILENAPAGLAQALATVLNLPLWGVLGIIGVVLALIFRPMD